MENFQNLSLLEVKLKNNKNININIIPDKNKPNKNDNLIEIPYSSFLTNQINQVIIKFNKNTKIELLINTKQQISDISFNENQIESLILFNNFNGTCSNIIIYKNNTRETYT